MTPSAARIAVCACLALGAQVQAIYHRAHDAPVAPLRTPFGSSGSSSSAHSADITAYYVSTGNCSEPAQCVIDPAECDVAASTLGLSAGYWPSVAYGGYCAKWDGGWGGVSSASSTWYYYHANNQAGAESICKLPTYSVGTTTGCHAGYSPVTDTTDCDAAAAVLGFTLGYWGPWNYGGSCAQWGAGWGSSTWYYHYASNQAGASPICKLGTYITATGSCPGGFVAITSTAECDAAATALGYTQGPFYTHDYSGTCAQWDGGWGSWGSAWYWYSASTQPGASLICAAVTAPPTPSPTPAPPTPDPTPSPTAATPSPTPPLIPTGGAGVGGISGVAGIPTGGAGLGPISATGDPHLQNIRGERFDVMKPGRHVLINIPRFISAENALLRVEADARRLGGSCSDMYFEALNITGAWADVKQTGGYRFQTEDVESQTPEWIDFGKIDIKVVHGRTQQGALYLNFYVKHLGRAGLAVGGLLGEDDHSDAETSPEECWQRISLLAQSADVRNHGATLSEAVALLD